MHSINHQARSDVCKAVYFHDGGTGGFTSCVLFNPKADYGIVVLINVEADYGELAENLCWHISQRLEGKPALSLKSQP